MCRLVKSPSPKPSPKGRGFEPHRILAEPRYYPGVIDYTLPLDELPDPLPIEPLEKPFDVTITPPGSKSITCRAYVLAALADGESRIIRPLRADDTDRLLDALCTLGAEARWDGEDVLINGVAGRFPRGGEINLGDGGAPTRFMIAAACLAAEPVVVDGSPRMRQRPIAEGVDYLRQLGAEITYLDQDEHLPVRVTPTPAFVGGEIDIPATTSSQFISALLLVGPFLPRGLLLNYVAGITSAAYVALTIQTLQHAGARIARHDGGCHGTTGQARDEIMPAAIPGRELHIEPDGSSAAYWYAAATMIHRARATVEGLSPDSAQPDMGLPYALTRAGAADDSTARGSSYSLRGGRKVRAISHDSAETPDGALALAVVAAMANGTSNLTGLRTLRVKESDRIAALESELGRIGCTVETTDDSITIDPSTRHNDPVVIETYNDHRMAMAFACLGLARPGISIKNPSCVAKSYPTFWKDFARLYY